MIYPSTYRLDPFDSIGSSIFLEVLLYIPGSVLALSGVCLLPCFCLAWDGILSYFIISFEGLHHIAFPDIIPIYRVVYPSIPAANSGSVGEKDLLHIRND